MKSEVETAEGSYPPHSREALTESNGRFCRIMPFGHQQNQLTSHSLCLHERDVLRDPSHLLYIRKPRSIHYDFKTSLMEGRSCITLCDKCLGRLGRLMNTPQKGTCKIKEVCGRRGIRMLSVKNWTYVEKQLSFQCGSMAPCQCQKSVCFLGNDVSFKKYYLIGRTMWSRNEFFRKRSEPICNIFREQCLLIVNK